jgi:NTP pyrophosphatase (non-canonical NTP hydrolase)
MISLRQKEFAKWQKDNFGEGSTSDMIHGMSEEVGEMNHAYLKSKQGIRNVTNEKAKEDMADAFGDIVVYGIQCMESLGLDAEEVLKEVFDKVLKRNWKLNPSGQ